MAIDTSMYSQIRQPDIAGNFVEGLKLGDMMRMRKADQAYSDVYNQAQGDPMKMAELALKTGYGAQILPRIQEQQASRQKAQLESDKTRSEVSKNNFGVAKDKSALVNQELAGLSAMGDKVTPQHVSFALQKLRLNGALANDEVQAWQQQLTNDPSQLQNMIQTAAMANLEKGKQMEYIAPDANSSLSANTTRRGQDIVAQTQANNLGYDYAKMEQGQSQFDARQSQQNDQFYYGQERQDARQQATITAQQAAKGKETMQQSMERQLAAQQAATMAQSAARASQAAATLINHKGLASGTGLTALSGKLPSTEAKAFQTDLENLKSQLFLPMIQQMRGMGALSNAEGAKVEAAVQNLDISINPQEMQRRLANVAEQMNQLAQVSAKEAKVYSTGGGRINTQQTTPNPFQEPSKPQDKTQKLKSIFGD